MSENTKQIVYITFSHTLIDLDVKKLIPKLHNDWFAYCVINTHSNKQMYRPYGK